MINPRKCLIGFYFVIFIIILSATISAERLPIVAGDYNEWGTILNEFLNVSIEENGTLREDAVNTSTILDGTIIEADLSDTINLTLGEKITFTLGGIIDNIVNGWIRIVGGLNVTNDTIIGGDLNVTGNITANYFIGDGSELTNVPGSVSVINFTSSSYNGNVTNGSLTGYEAANNICDSEFSGAHTCTQHEISSYIAFAGAASLSASQISWVIAGGAKYAPADHPVNDCDGFTNEGTGATDPLGSFWSFNNINGGKGIAGNCGLSYPLACCK